MPSKKKAVKRVKAGNSRATAAKRKALFIEAYLSNGRNATDAAKTAGYAHGSAHVRAAELVKNSKVAAEIERRSVEVLDAAQKITGITVERTLREVGRLAYSDSRKFFKTDGTMIPLHELDDDTASTIASIEVDEIKADGAVIGVTRKLKVWDKNSALEKAMKNLGLYKEDNKQIGESLALHVAFGRDASK